MKRHRHVPLLSFPLTDGRLSATVCSIPQGLRKSTPVERSRQPRFQRTCKTNQACLCGGVRPRNPPASAVGRVKSRSWSRYSLLLPPTRWPCRDSAATAPEHLFAPHASTLLPALDRFASACDSASRCRHTAPAEWM